MLTDTQCRKAAAADRPYKLFDAGGLYLYVTPAGGRHWKLKYRFAGKEKKLPIGPYPEVTLAQARDRRDEARRMLRDSVDPSVERKRRVAVARADADTTFEKLAREWHHVNKSLWCARHSDDVIDSLVRDVFPAIGALPIKSITTSKVLETLRKIEDRPAIETAKRVRQRMSAVFSFAISQELADDDPALKVGAIGISELHERVTAPGLLEQRDSAVAVLHVGRMDQQLERPSVGIDHGVALSTFDLLAGVVAARTACLGGLHALTIDHGR